jgi:hypothetical protein
MKMEDMNNKLLESRAAKKELRRKEALGNYLTGDRRPDAAFRRQYGPNWRVKAKPEEKPKAESLNLDEISDEELAEILGLR